MSATAIRYCQTSIFKDRGKNWRPRRCLYSSSTLSSHTQSRLRTSSLAKELQEHTELSAVKTRGRGRQRLSERFRDKNSIEDYLGHLQTTKHDLTLEDIERYRPKEIADPKSPDYETTYNDVVGSLMRSFSQPQLRQFLQLYDLPRPHHRSNKRAFAVKILEEKWGWPSLEKVSQDRIDWSEVSERQFYLDAPQSFLLMGKDGTNLLSLSRRYNVSLSFTANPMSLRVTGLKGALKQIEAYLETLKKDIGLDIVSLPFGRKLGSEMEQSISRLAGAYVKTLDDTKLSISFLKSQPQTLSVAKQLIMQVATKKANFLTPALYIPNALISSESSSSLYSLFPFSPPQPLSWQTPPGSTFRYRRIGTWTNAAHLLHSDKSGALADALDTMTSSASTRINLRKRLTDMLSSGASQQLSSSISSCFGHILFLSPSAQRATLMPPLTGPTDAAAVLRWAEEHPDHVVFSPNVPKVVSSASTHKHQHFKRLVYQAETADYSPDFDDRLNTLTIEVPQVPASQALMSDDGTSEVHSLDHVSCFASTEKNIDILIPTRQVQTDLRLSANQAQAIPASDLPQALLFFLLDRAQQADSTPNLPLTFMHFGVNHFLRSNSYVRRQHKQVDVGDMQVDLLIETVFYPESGQTVTSCKIVCEDHHTSSGWKKFVRTCDLLIQPHGVDIRRPAETFSPFD